jgi:hypothetical protein
MLLETRRVRVTDSRMYVQSFFILFVRMLSDDDDFVQSCPQCHKRLGTSVIAVHAPR